MRSVSTPMIALFVAVGLAPGSLRAQDPGGHDDRVLAVEPTEADEPIAPRLEGLGDHHHEVTTASPEAQRYFDQGLRLTYGFNHKEALRAFKEAVRLDPECAMAYWGWALVLGPNLNLPMRPEVVPQAYDAVQRAVALADAVSPRERAFIEALAERYSPDPEADRAPLDRAYAEAMGRVHRRYRDDDDAATLYAAALMNLSPWDYWTPDGRPRQWTPEVLETLELVIDRSPKHVGALHYYIHAVEAERPELAEPAADALRGLTPGAGHLVHMPSHIDMRVGRYGDAVAANRRAVAADEGYIAQCRRQGLYPLNYYPHNLHFLAWAATLQGRSAEALEASRRVAAAVPDDREGDAWALYQTFLSMPLFTMARFGLWDAILEEPRPPLEATYWRGIWHYARGLALAHQGDVDAACAEARELERIAHAPAAEELPVGYNDAELMLEIAGDLLDGEIAAAGGDYRTAVRSIGRAVRLQDGLPYIEPPDWIYPARHSLGAVLLEAGQPEEAEVVYWQDLRRYPENGYALFGLAQSLRAQGEPERAVAVERRFEEAWSEADVELSSSRY